ncbi:MAG: 23S rRNA (uracil(1939)-C(5))-methyltransferase RlmD [Lachnospiraceae bacterium]|nr:23S rRNA (uracil(1939)-C(5))-methyltransferase RlmD [Lachnospiraceae bacterium]
MNFEAFIRDIEQNRWAIYGVEVYENDELTHRWGDTKKARHLLYSCTKTILSLGVGIAWDRGLIDLDAPIASYLPQQYVSELAPEQAEMFQTLSVERFMCMSVKGFPFRVAEEEKESYLRYSLSCKIDNPGERSFDYSNIPAYLVGVALSQVIGGDVWAFLEENLLHPLHIYGAPCTRCPEGWFYGASGMELTVHELSRIGLMLYHDGMYEGKRIVSSEYIALMTSVHQWNREGGYGLLTQLYRDGFRISGKHNQRCFVLKSRGLVVTYLCDMPGDGNAVTESVERNLFGLTPEKEPAVQGAAAADGASVKTPAVASANAVSGKKAAEPAAEEKIPEGPCSFAKKCGGCAYQGLTYEEQLKKKAKKVSLLLSKYCKPSHILGAANPMRYRNKVHGVFGRDKKRGIYTGIYEEGTHKIVPVSDCRIENATGTAILKTLCGLAKSFRYTVYDEDRGTGLLRHALIRIGKKTGEVMVVLVLTDPILPSKNNFVKELRRLHPEITTVVLNINDKHTSMVLGERNIVLYGKGYIEDVLCGLRFRISPSSFYQINPEQTEVLYRTAMEFAALSGTEKVIDAYCGIGTIGMCAAGKASQVTGIELNRDAVKDAVSNAKRNDMKNIGFVCADAGDYMVKLAGQGEKADVVFMDPPRNGSTPEFIKAVDTLAPDRVVYISCNPETLARDLGLFAAKGWKVQRVQAVDMFPWTEHAEAVCLLSKHRA